MNDIEIRLEVTKVTVRTCGEIAHAAEVHFANDGGTMSDEDAIAVLKAGGELYMIPPPGAPGYQVYRLNNIPLILQWRVCNTCGKEVLFA